MTQTEIQRVEVRELAPLLTSMNAVVMEVVGKEIVALTEEVNTAIEKGVETDDNAKAAESTCTQGLNALKAAHEVRMEYTRPLDQVKDQLIKEEQRVKKQLMEGTARLDMMLKSRADRIRREEEEARAKIAEENRLREEAARKEEERRANISKAKGGVGNFKPVEVQKVVAPVVTRAGMRNTTKVRYIKDVVKIQAAVDNGVREIPGVRIYPVWQYEITDPTLLPMEYKKPSRR